MLAILNKIYRNRWIFRSILSSVYFNFRVLPIKQAIRLPILLYKPKFVNCLRGGVFINGEIIPGMIRLGINIVPIYHNHGIMIQNAGTIIFNGPAVIGNDSAISVGKNGVLNIGRNFSATAKLKLVCFHQITLSNDVLIGWDCMICDTDFHKLTTIKDSNKIGKGYGSVYVAENVWIANSCKLYKNTSIPPFCVIGSDTILRKHIKCDSHTLIVNQNSILFKTTGIYLNRANDEIDYTT